jgi:hypothetical protein
MTKWGTLGHIIAFRREEKLVSDNSKCIRRFEGGRGLTSNFLRGGGMDVFWNDSMDNLYHKSSERFVEEYVPFKKVL